MTPNTLQQVTAELATTGDLKLVDRPSPVTIGPLHHETIKANVKVSVYEDVSIMMLNNLHDFTGFNCDPCV